MAAITPTAATTTAPAGTSTQLNFFAKKFFLTYPQCDLPKQELLDALSSNPDRPIIWAVLSRELHEDGNPHLHVALEFKAAIRFRRADYFDVAGYHPNIQSMRFLWKCLDYVTKSDPEPLTYGPVPSRTFGGSGHNSVGDDVASKIIEGASYDEIVALHPGYALTNKRKLDEFIAYQSVKRQRLNLLPWSGISTTATIHTEPDIAILIDWLNTSIKKDRPPRSPQLFLFGSPGIGKTRLINQLSEYLSIYQIPRDEAFYDSWEDKAYDLAVLDEFKSNKTIQWLNTWLDGNPMPLRMKGRQYLKLQRVPTIILSNFSLVENFPNATIARQALSQRLTLVELTQPFVLDFSPLTAPSSPCMEEI